MITLFGVKNTCALLLVVSNIASRIIMNYAASSFRDLGLSRRCCNGTLGYAWDHPYMPCGHMRCCNEEETVALIHIDFALGFRFHCLPKARIKPECYAAGIEVRSTNQDPDLIPRTCCDGAKFEVVVNQWYAAMVIRCTSR
ncbi:uncharacterized protein LOC135461788 [Liolophura sinensis]|uniref:uncharacterized protein LOC135461788 n=1 Tax=Liolophura sinensis TaxID=3198878 RepID=UPI0031595DC0